MARTARRWVRFVVVLATLGSLAVPWGGGAAADQGAAACSPSRLSSMAPVARPDAEFNDLWTSYGNDNSRKDDWTGGDGTYSVQLPNGRVVWMFSDTFLGTVNPDGTRPAGTPLINNSYVVQRDGALVRTLHGGTRQAPTALIAPSDASWYWMNDAIVEGTNLRQFLSTFRRTGPGAWDWEWIRTDVASYSLRTFELKGVHRVPDGNGVDYGIALLADRKHTYVFGVEDLPSAKYLHLARAPAGSVLGRWTFWTGSRWSSDPTESARIRSGVSNSASVVRSGNVYVLLTQDSTVPFGSEIVAYFACHPQGPWGHRAHVYTTPESGTGDLYTYNALAHPELTDESGTLVSYNVNTFEGSQHLSDVTIYRPRFLRVTFGG